MARREREECVTVPTTVQLRVFEKTLSQRSSVGLNLRLLLSRRSRLRYSDKCGKVSPVRKARPGLRNIQTDGMVTEKFIAFRVGQAR